MPQAVWVADDGSGPTTAALIAAHASAAPYPVHHVRQEHAGFRVARLRNLALAAAARSDTPPTYVVLLDGDMVMHPELLADHARAARSGHWVQGTRTLLGEAASQALIERGDLPGPFSAGVGGLRRAYLWHAPRVQPLLARLGNAFVSIKACNQGFWLDDLLRTNGFDATIEGWGPEDKELCARLANSGIRRRTLLAGGIALHLAHPPAPRTQRGCGEQVLRETIRTRRQRCEHGIDA